MIDFTCAQCGKKYSVKNEFGGRKGKCKDCGYVNRIPEASAPVAATPAPGGKIKISFDDPAPTGAPLPASAPAAPALPGGKPLSMRMRRLLADRDTLQTVLQHSPFIRVSDMQGNPPERYTIEYRVKSLVRGGNGAPVAKDQHLVEIQLTSEYPRQSPKCKMLTPIFHPNIDPVSICVGDHWTAQERLVDLIVRIGQILAYQAYNIKSPLDGEAAMWADLNRNLLPTDSRDLTPPEKR